MTTYITTTDSIDADNLAASVTVASYHLSIGAAERVAKRTGATVLPVWRRTPEINVVVGQRLQTYVNLATIYAITA